jgi:hypothetical protein
MYAKSCKHCIHHSKTYFVADPDCREGKELIVKDEWCCKCDTQSYTYDWLFTKKLYPFKKEALNENKCSNS